MSSRYDEGQALPKAVEHDSSWTYITRRDVEGVASELHCTFEQFSEQYDWAFVSYEMGGSGTYRYRRREKSAPELEHYTTSDGSSPNDCHGCDAGKCQTHRPADWREQLQHGRWNNIRHRGVAYVFDKFLPSAVRMRSVCGGYYNTVGEGEFNGWTKIPPADTSPCRYVDTLIGCQTHADCPRDRRERDRELAALNELSRLGQEMEFQKADAGKPDLAILPYTAMCAWADGLSHGEKVKGYKRNNWRLALPRDEVRLRNAALRHLHQYNEAREKGEPGLDQESGLSHLSLAMCNIGFLIELAERSKK